MDCNDNIFKVLDENDFKVSSWSGGTTKELFIFPSSADVAKRDFKFRISSAVIEGETSVFSDFSGYHRQITPLDSSIKIVHQEHYEKQLAPLEIDVFEGSWSTTSFGKCTDFNLIYNNNWEGNLRILDNITTIEPKLLDYVFVYVIIGNVECSTNQSLDSRMISAHQLLFVDTSYIRLNQSIVINKDDNAKAILITMKHK